MIYAEVLQNTFHGQLREGIKKEVVIVEFKELLYIGYDIIPQIRTAGRRIYKAESKNNNKGELKWKK